LTPSPRKANRFGFKLCARRNCDRLKVTLPGLAWFTSFLDRLISSRCRALPELSRACRPRAFDGQGNYSLGVKERSCFFSGNPVTDPIDQGFFLAGISLSHYTLE